MTALKRLFRIQYVCDIHLEFYEKATFPLLVKPAAKYLALAGDIGQPNTQIWNSFFDYVSRHWERIFYVTGNHEYYSKRKNMDEIHREIKESLKAFPRVTMLDEDYPSCFLSMENIVIVGSTLWTNIPASHKSLVQHSMNDYNKIYYDNKQLTTDIVNRMYSAQRRRLEETIQFYDYQKIPTIVLTHHMPSFQLISPRYAGSEVNFAFASNCEDLMMPSVRCWIYGHTHNCSNARLKKTMCLVNARGYPNESCPGFSSEAFFEFDTTSEETEIDEDLVRSAVKAEDPIEFI